MKRNGSHKVAFKRFHTDWYWICFAEEGGRSAVQGRGKRVGPRSPAVFSTPVRSQRPKISRMTASPIKHSSARRNIFPEQQKGSSLISQGKESEENQPADQGCAILLTTIKYFLFWTFEYFVNFFTSHNTRFLHYNAEVIDLWWNGHNN